MGRETFLSPCFPLKNCASYSRLFRTVLGTGLFVVLILGYLSRRQIRSTVSRLAHALSHGHTAQFIQTHLHTVHYTRLHDLDTITSPIESERGSIDLESAAAHANQDPAPPYSPQSAQVSNMRERKSKRSLHITVPVVQTAPSQASGSCIEQDITSSTALAEAEAEATTPLSSCSAPNSGTAQQTVSRARSLSNASVALASPIASRLDAYFRPYRYVPIESHQESGNNTCLFNVSNRSDSLMSTESPCATPPPQYTITIHSSYRLTRCDSTGRPAPVPDIILSPVPWLPRERVPKSPPHYLSIPSRKSRSRRQDVKVKADLGKALPVIQDQKNAEKRQRKPKSTEVKVRHVFSSPVALSVPDLAHKTVPTAPTPKVSKPKQPLPRSATYPIQKRALPPLPPPRPVIPMDLEPVYPVEHTPVPTESPSSSEPSDSWLWPTWPNTAPVGDRRLARTENEVRRSSYGVEKVAYVEKGDWKREVVDNGSDSDDVPLAQELLLAMKRKTMAIEMNVGRVRQSPALDVPRALRKGLFSGLSALAAKARMVIERELDSDEENEEENIEEEERRLVRHRNFVARDLDATGAFVIGEED